MDIGNNPNDLTPGLKQKEAWWIEEDMRELLKVRKEAEKIKPMPVFDAFARPIS